MAFILPAFNLSVNIWRSSAGQPPVGAPDVVTIGNLAMGRRVQVGSIGGTTSLGVPFYGMSLLVPALTDVRADPYFTSADTVEVPAGSGRWYYVVFVDDIGKGFANEHRAAQLVQYLRPTWPVPTP
jgi:hypothetical protein